MVEATVASPAKKTNWLKWGGIAVAGIVAINLINGSNGGSAGLELANASWSAGSQWVSVQIINRSDRQGGVILRVYSKERGIDFCKVGAYVRANYSESVSFRCGSSISEREQFNIKGTWAENGEEQAYPRAS